MTAIETTAALPVEPLLIPPCEVAHLLGISVRTLWRLLAAGEVPEPVRLRKAVRWRRSDIEAWLVAGCPAQNHQQGARQSRRAR